MPMPIMTKARKHILKHKRIEDLIVEVRKKKVILDYEVAMLYGVQTKDVNRAVKNNPDKFLKGYVIELNNKELRDLWWKISTTNRAIRRK